MKVLPTRDILAMRPERRRPFDMPRLKLLSTLWPFALLLALGLFVLAEQPYFVGFSRELHGWGSSHTLAAFSRADADHYYVGHTLDIKDEAGRVQQFYFDRYPIWLSMVGNHVLNSGEPSLGSQIHRTRQFMNCFFIATLIFAFLHVRLIVTDNSKPWPSFFSPSQAIFCSITRIWCILIIQPSWVRLCRCMPLHVTKSTERRDGSILLSPLQ
jgi:hypothetical protein